MVLLQVGYANFLWEQSSWLDFIVELYFLFYKLSEDEMLKVVAMELEGDTLRWKQWEQKHRPIWLWSYFKTFVLRQFWPVHGWSLYEQWLATNQSSSVQDYKWKFIKATGQGGGSCRSSPSQSPEPRAGKGVSCSGRGSEPVTSPRKIHH